MPTVYARLLKKPDNSILLFGPRGTGKTTWIHQNFENAVHYDLLDSKEALRLERNPEILYNEVRSLPAGRWVVVDEVQKVPELMDEVHRIIESLKLKVILCGSSARKLKRGGANLLAGRAIVTNLYPLTSSELGEDFDLTRALVHGTLPLAVSSPDAEGFLATYATVYLNEEIRAEALTRNVGAFSRFLEIAARQNGQVTNISNIARDAGVGRTTVQNYFDILEDTLIGYWLPAWKLKMSTKQVAHPKCYFFDTGVARALSGRLPYPPTQEEAGVLFDNLFLNEIRSYLSYNSLRYPVFFWRNYEGIEVDFLCETRKGFVAVEFKSTEMWQRRYNHGLLRIKEDLSGNEVALYGVYRGQRRVRSGDVDVFPAEVFLDMLWQGEVLG